MITYKKISLGMGMLLAGIVSISHPVVAQETISNVNKQKVVEAVNNHAGELISLSDEIWEYAEIAFKESQSADALVEYAEANGFKVTRGVGEIPTAFVAEYGSGGPIIGIMGEFDALPGLSQDAVPHKSPLIEGNPGHGAGS